MMVRAYGGLENVATAGYLEPLTVETMPALADFAPSGARRRDRARRRQALRRAVRQPDPAGDLQQEDLRR
jgi:hypothetical protein